MATTTPPPLTPASPALRTFPKPNTGLALVIGDPDARRAFHRRLQASNKLVVFFYRIGLLPLLGLGKNTMLLITAGRRSGRRRIFPVGYFRLGGEIYQISGWGRSSNWYKNIHAHPDELQLQIGFRTFAAQAEFIEDPAGVQRVLEQLVTQCPAEAKRLLGWDPASDCLETADFSPCLDKVMLIRYLPAGQVT
jgi:deazaflavin-dependent oxidoreductase (nitroreductase family)